MKRPKIKPTTTTTCTLKYLPFTRSNAAVAAAVIAASNASGLLLLFYLLLPPLLLLIILLVVGFKEQLRLKSHFH